MSGKKKPLIGIIFLVLFLNIVSSNQNAYSDNSSAIIERIVLNELGQADTPGFARDVVVKGSIAYVTDLGSPTSTYGGLLIFNISQPQNPIEIGHFWDGGRAHHIIVRENIVFVADNTDGLEVINASDLFNPRKIGHFNGTINDLDINGNIIHATDWHKGLIVLDISNASHPVEIGSFSNVENAQPITIASNLAYVSDTNGLKVLNTTTPSNITELAQYDYDLNNVQFTGNTAYMACDDGVRICDTSNPHDILELGYYSDGGRTIDLHVFDDFVAASDRIDGIEVIDIRNPSHLTEIFQHYDGGNASDIQVVDDLIFVADGSDGLEIIEISYISLTKSSSTPSFEPLMAFLGLISILVLRKEKTAELRRIGHEKS